MTGMQVRNVLALAQQRQFAMHDEADGHRPFVLSRAGAAGSQRFGASPWTGDIGSTWIDMARQPRLLMNAGLSGIPFAGCDVGGFFGDPEPELFARWMQSAALMPVMRAHASLSDREPWSAGDEALPHVAAAIRLRSRLLPSLVSWAYASVRDGLPVMRAMALAFPDDADLAGVDDQWMAGPILCAPVLERQQRTRTVRLPSGSWQRIRHDADGRLSAVGDVVDGPVSVDVDVELHDLPMFMQAGSVVLVDPAPMDRRSYAWPPPQLEAFAVADASGTATGHFTFDEGTGLAWRDGAEVTASVEVDQGTLQTVVVDGDAGLMPEVVASA